MPGSTDQVGSLQRGDPPTLGDLQVVGRLQADESAVVYAGERDGEPAVAIMLSDGAASDSYARARFQDAIAARHERSGDVVAFESDDDFAPWAVLGTGSYDAGVAAAGPIVAALTLADHPSVGTSRGPGFSPHWFRRGGRGRWRLWPLPWPRWLRAAGMWTFSAAFALICLIAATALLISVLLLRTLPPPPTPPSPTNGPNLPVPPLPATRTPTTPGPSPTPSTGTPQVPSGTAGSGNGPTPII